MVQINNIPLYFQVGKIKKRNISLNLNTYRNLHYQVSNNVKKLMVEWVKENVKDIELFPKMLFRYKIYRKTKRKADLDNIGSIVHKFLADALVECGFMEDDNTDFIHRIEFIDGGVAKDNARADLTILCGFLDNFKELKK